MTMPEFHILETYDGNELVLGSGLDVDMNLQATSNFGAPPTEFQTRRGYRQDGVTEISYNLLPRPISISVFRSHSCTRAEYWDLRQELLDFLRPNRGGPLTYKIIRPDNTQRALTVRADPGLAFNTQATRNNWDIEEPITFIAHDPLWFDPTEATPTISTASGDELSVPVNVPVQVGILGVQFSTGTLSYAGTWKTYPTITLIGPYTSCAIYNRITGASLNFTTNIIAGERRIIDLTPGSQSVQDSEGVNKFSELAPSSNLVDFYIQSELAENGTALRMDAVFVGGSDGVSNFILEYYNRYFGI